MKLQYLSVGALWGVMIAIVSSEKHHLFVGNLGAPAMIHALEFDDETYELKLVNNITADSSHPWITFNHDRTNLYAVSAREPKISNYVITSQTNLRLVESISPGLTCKNRTSAFVMASQVQPYNVYVASWPGPNACALSLSTFANGTLDKAVDSWGYAPTSAVHGFALGSSTGFGNAGGQLLYSADLGGDTIWTHRVRASDGKVTQVGRHTVAAGSHPRHLAVHPQGQYLYSVMEAGNRVAAFSLSSDFSQSGYIDEEESSYSLLPTELAKDTANYWSAEVMLSPDARYLWATARAQQNTTLLGYISAFLLDDDGTIVKRMFMVPTTTRGGIANAIAPAPWSSAWAAMADFGTGYVQMWRMTGRNQSADGTVEYTSATAVARVNISDGGCCANVAWYD